MSNEISHTDKLKRDMKVWTGSGRGKRKILSELTGISQSTITRIINEDEYNLSYEFGMKINAIVNPKQKGGDIVSDEKDTLIGILREEIASLRRQRDDLKKQMAVNENP